MSRSCVFNLLKPEIIKWILDEHVHRFSLEKTSINWVPFLKLSFFIHEVRYKRDSKHIFFLLLSMLFYGLVRRDFNFFSHTIYALNCKESKNINFGWYKAKTTTAWVIGLGPKNSCSPSVRAQVKSFRSEKLVENLVTLSL